MSDTVSDILDESERSSIRGTLMHLAQQQVNASRRASAITVDPYMRECNIWIKQGMSSADVDRVLHAKLGLKMDNGVYPTPGSTRVKHIKCEFGSRDVLERVIFAPR